MRAPLLWLRQRADRALTPTRYSCTSIRNDSANSSQESGCTNRLGQRDRPQPSALMQAYERVPGQRDAALQLRKMPSQGGSVDFGDEALNHAGVDDVRAIPRRVAQRAKRDRALRMRFRLAPEAAARLLQFNVSGSDHGP